VALIRRLRWVIKSGRSKEAGVCRPNHPRAYNVYGEISRYGVGKLQPVTETTKLVASFKTLEENLQSELNSHTAMAHHTRSHV
jgi:hypothetical protein